MNNNKTDKNIEMSNNINYKKIDNNNLNEHDNKDTDKINKISNIKKDLDILVKEFAIYQKQLYQLEKEEEERINIENILIYNIKELETMGICMTKLEVLELTFTSYGKYLTKFCKRGSNDVNYNCNSKYKFGGGDVVGLYNYQDKLSSVPITKGVVTSFNRNCIEVAFDLEFEPENYSKNIALVQLSNYITFDKINFTLNKLSQFLFKPFSFPLLNVVFGINTATFNNHFKDNNNYNSMIIKQNINISKYNDKILSNSYGNTIEYYNESLNNSQKEAINFALKANELALIHGPPGTGKTTTVVELILQAVLLGQKVLVAAPSNISVDNIAEKLVYYKECLDYNNKNRLKFEMTRLGHPARLLESIISISLNTQVENSIELKSSKELSKQIENKRKEINRFKSRIKFKKENTKVLNESLKDLNSDIKIMLKQLKGNYKQAVYSLLNKANIVLGTLVGCGDNNLYNTISKWDKPYFDLLIIDECAQATEAMCWIPMLLAKKVVLAGDHLQLPPTIKNNSIAKDLGYTLFDRIMDMYIGQEDTCSRLLNVQYRMNNIIMSFSNNEFYDNKLISDESVKNHKLNDLNYIKEISHDSINDNLSLIDKNLIFVNTGNYNFEESCDTNNNGSKFNYGEAKVVIYLVKYFICNLKILKEDIGVITPYSSQVSILKEELSQEIMNSNKNNTIEISTVDGFQGREKEIIIVSLVRSNYFSDIGFLYEKRRLNVALTRPKRLLCVVGDGNMLINYDNYKFLGNLGEYLYNNSFQLDILDNIFTYNEIEEIRFKYSNNTNITKKDNNLCNKSIVNLSNKKNNNKNRKNKKEAKDIVKDINKHKENNWNEIIIENKNNTDKNKEYESKIIELIDNFIKSPISSYTLTGLNSFERLFVHKYAEKVNLNHISKGEGTKRQLILEKSNNKQNVLEKENQNTFINIDQNKVTDNNEYKHLSDSTIKSNKNIIINNNNTKIKKNKIDNDDDDDFLNYFVEKSIINECQFGNCRSKNDILLCKDCNMKYCKSHYIKSKHGCEYHNLTENIKDNSFNKQINNKLKDLQSKRTRKIKNNKNN